MSRFSGALPFLIFCFTLAVSSRSAKAQENTLKNRLYIEGNWHYGFVMPQHDYISYFINQHVTGYQLNVGMTTNGQKKWQQFYNDPQIGLGFYHSNLGNNAVYGHITALFGYVDRYFLAPNCRFNIGNRIAFGLGYVSKKYDPATDQFNLAIASHMNVYLNYCLEGKARLAPRLGLKLGLGFSHTSNGNLKQPNKGLNLITSFVSLQYSLQKPVKPIRLFNTEVSDSDKNQYLLFGSYGNKQISRAFKTRYTVWSLSPEYSRRITRTGWLGLAAGFYYDRSLIKEIETDTNDPIRPPGWDMLRISLQLSYELKMGKLSYVIQPGIYLKNAYTKTGPITNRIGLRYQISDKIVAAVTIKAHWVAIADYIEWGIAYRWKN